MPVENGVIGYFDILGYQNLLTNNEPEDVAEKVLSRITSLNGTVTDELTAMFPKLVAGKYFDPILSATHWLVFSDTILLTNAFPDQEKDFTRFLRWYSILVMCSRVQSYMFKNGLPVRGVLHFGKFMVKDPCFAGRPIIEAYQLANTLELAATVMTDVAAKKLDEARALTVAKNNAGAYFDYLLKKYLVPLKDGKDQHFLTVDYFDSAELAGKDIRQAVFNSFWQHRKDIPGSVQAKVVNTEQHLRFLAHLKPEKKKANEGSEPTAAPPGGAASAQP